MRLRRLDLTRYGLFTDRRIDFGARADNGCDLHIIYGPNEAGKSTALAAYLDLLFGIGTQSRYSFLHPYSAMRIGCAIELPNGVQEFIRIKRPQNSLLDAREQPIADSAILGALGGIDRESYSTMFSLDDDTLEAGGESILASKGDLGQLLFSASAGLADLSQNLVELRSGADSFYRYKARSGALLDLKGELDTLKAERKCIDTQAHEYGNLVGERDRAKAHYDQALENLAGSRVRRDEIMRHQSALPRLRELRSLRDRLAPLAVIPDAPDAWTEDVRKLQKEEIELAVQADLVEREIGRLSADIASIDLDHAALRLTKSVENLADLHARHVTAEKDIPVRREQIREPELAISDILNRIERRGEADPARLVLASSTVARLRELVQDRSGIDALLSATESEVTKARRSVEEAVAMLGEQGEGSTNAPAKGPAIAALAAAANAERTVDRSGRRKSAERSLEAEQAALADCMRDLRPWHGDADALSAMPVPGADAIDRWKSAIGKAERLIDRHADAVEQLESQIAILAAEHTAIGRITGVVTDEDAASIRASREQAWAEHRRLLDPGSADRFESLLRRDDIVTGNRLNHWADVTKLHQAAKSLAEKTAERDRAIELRDNATENLRALRGEIGDAIRAMAPTLPPEMSVAQLEAWLARRETAVKAARTVRVADRAFREAADDAASAREGLANALMAVDVMQRPDATIETLLESALATIERERTLGEMRGAARLRQRELEDREREAEQAAAKDRSWQADWTATCSSCWLGEAHGSPTLATVREVLNVIDKLGAALREKASLADRIDKMEKDRIEYRERLAACAGEMDLAPTTGDAIALAQAVNERVRRAESDRDLRARAIVELEKAQRRQREIAEVSAIRDRHKLEMTSHFGVSSLRDVEGKLTDLKTRGDLLGLIAEAERDIVELLRAPSIAEAEDILDREDHAALEAEFGELEIHCDLEQRRCNELYASQKEAADRVNAVGGDARVAAIEERRRTTLLEIEDGAARYLRLRMGAVAAEQALRAYRERHRGAMMTRASAAFKTVSRGAYAGLSTQPGKDGDILIALSASGGSKAAQELSKGTRFQLYLALRVAGYHEFARHRGAVPFIADDILETFDDFRAEEAIRLFAEMAEVGQVIYLTHHRHLCDIARQVCPGATIHQLGTVVSQTGAVGED